MVYLARRTNSEEKGNKEIRPPSSLIYEDHDAMEGREREKEENTITRGKYDLRSHGYVMLMIEAFLPALSSLTAECIGRSISCLE